MKIMERIDDLNRSERYFTATILPYFLAFNSFEYLSKFVSVLEGPTAPSEDDFETIELIAEVDFIRDSRKWAEIQADSEMYEQYDGLLRDTGRLAVPDVFIKYGKTIIVIEGKFFQKQRAIYYEEQISLQREVIELIRNEYPDYSFFHVFLTADNTITHIQGTDRVIHWQKEVMSLANKISQQYPNHRELEYFRERLENAISRYEQEFEKPTETTDLSGTIRFYELGALLEYLIQDDQGCFVGFTGGIQALLSLTLLEAQERSHWKVNDRQLTEKNWIPKERFLAVFGIDTSILGIKISGS